MTPLTATRVDDVAVRRALAWAMRAALLKVEPAEGGGWSLTPVEDDTDEGMDLQFEANRRVRRHSRMAKSDEDARRALELYQQAKTQAIRNPYKWVGEQMHISRSSAQRLAVIAREAEELREAKRGRSR